VELEEVEEAVEAAEAVVEEVEELPPHAAIDIEIISKRTRSMTASAITLGEDRLLSSRLLCWSATSTSMSVWIDPRLYASMTRMVYPARDQTERA
jgi:hypothetical protein